MCKETSMCFDRSGVWFSVTALVQVAFHVLFVLDV